MTSVPPGLREPHKTTIAADVLGIGHEKERVAMIHWRLMYDRATQEDFVEKSLVNEIVRLPDAEWGRLLDMAVKLRDDMMDSGTFSPAIVMNVQAAIAVLSDPQSRPAERSAAIDKIYKMSEALEKPIETKPKPEEEIAKRPTMDLLKRLKAAAQKQNGTA